MNNKIYTLKLDALALSVISAALDEVSIPNKLYRQIVPMLQEQIDEQNKPEDGGDGQK